MTSVDEIKMIKWFGTDLFLLSCALFTRALSDGSSANSTMSGGGASCWLTSRSATPEITDTENNRNQLLKILENRWGLIQKTSTESRGGGVFQGVDMWQKRTDHPRETTIDRDRRVTRSTPFFMTFEASRSFWTFSRLRVCICYSLELESFIKLESQNKYR